MASTYTDRLGFEKQATGENLSSWGERLNGALELIDEAIAGVVEISLTGNKTLSATINVSNENRQSALFFTDGGFASSPTVTVANEENWWFVRNGTGFAITFTAGGDTATIADGNIAVVICDGTDCIAWDPAALAETYAANALASQQAAASSASTASTAASTATSAATSASNSLAALNAKITISTSAPSGGSDGDLWFRIA